MASLLLYRFSQGEILQLQTMLGFLPDVKVIPVERTGFGMKMGDVLDGNESPAVLFGRDMDRKMLVIADAKGELFHMLLSAAGQVTKGQNVLRAMVTETNRAWTGLELYEHLIEEEAELSALQRS